MSALIALIVTGIGAWALYKVMLGLLSPTWEYMILDSDEVGDLDKLGSEGWELVTAVFKSWENERKGYTESTTVYYFKRRPR